MWQRLSAGGGVLLATIARPTIVETAFTAVAKHPDLLGDVAIIILSGLASHYAARYFATAK